MDTKLKKILWFFATVLGMSSLGHAQGALAGFNGDCTVGGQQVLTQGMASSGTKQIHTNNILQGAGVQASFPNCTVTVYGTGTLTKPNIFSNNLASPTPLSNPFTANVDGSFTFFILPGACFDIVMSSGTGPSMPYPRSLTDVCIGTGGGGGGGSPGGPVNSLQLNNFGAFSGSPNLTFDPNANILSLNGALSQTGNYILTGSLGMSGSLTVGTGITLTGSFTQTGNLSQTGNTLISGTLGVGGNLTTNMTGGPFCVHETAGVLSATTSDCGGGGGGLTGTGTVGTIPIWKTSPTNLGNSVLSQITFANGTILTNAGSAPNGGQVTGIALNITSYSTSACANNFSPATSIPINGGIGCYAALFSTTDTSAAANSGSGGMVIQNQSSSSQLSMGLEIINQSSQNGAGSESRGLEVDNEPGSTNTTNSRAIVAYSAGPGTYSLNQGVYILRGSVNVSGSITNDYGLYVESPIATGTLTHTYGVFLADQTVGGVKNPDPHGFWELGTAPNQFGGSLTLANLASGSVQCLHVSTTGLISGTGSDCGSGGSGLPSGTGVLTIVGGVYGPVLSETGTGNAVLSNNPILVAPNLGTPTTLVLTNATGAPTWNQNTTGTSAGFTGCSPVTAGSICIWNGSSYVNFPGNTSGTASLQENASGVPSWGAGSSTTFQVNTVALSSATTVNFLNSAATNGQTFTFTNTSAGNIQLGVTGTLNNAGLTNSATTVNGQTCTLGSPCTIPEQVNTVNLTSTAGFNLITSTTNAVGLTVTPTNSATNQIKFEITGGSYTGNAAGLFGSPSITVTSITGQTLNGLTLSGTFPGNPTFSGSPVFGTMTGGPFCVHETGGVLSATTSDCGSGGSVGTGTLNAVTFWSTTTTLGSVSSAVSGQVLVSQGTANPPIWSSPSMFDSGNSPVSTTPYTVQCDSPSTLLDRSTTIRFRSGASVINIPASSGSGCSGLAFIAMDDGAGTITFNASGADTFSVFSAGTATDGATSFTLTNGQFASLNQAATNLWDVRITNGGTISSITFNAGLSGGTITSSGTVGIANLGVTGAMIANATIGVSKIAVQTQNTVLGSFTGTSVQALPIASGNGNNQAVQYQTNVGFIIGSDFGQLDVASTWTALQTFGTNISIGGVQPSGASGSGSILFGTSPTITSATLSGASTVVPSGATITIQSGGSLVCAGGSTCPTGTGTVTHTAGALTSGAIVVGNAGADLKTPSATSTLDSSGNMSLPGTFSAAGLGVFSAAGSSGSPGLSITGLASVGNGSTNNYPQLYVRTSSNNPAGWSANGTQFGINSQAAFTGNEIDIHKDGATASIFSVDASGDVTVAVGAFVGSLDTGGPRFNFAANSISANKPLTLSSTTNQLVTGTSTNLTTVNFPASSGAVTITMPNITTTLAAADVALTYNALQTFGTNISIGGTTATGATGTGNVAFSISPTFTGTLTAATLAATTINGAALSGTFTGTPTISGNWAFTGTPTFSNPLALGSSTATTAAACDNSTLLATTAYTNTECTTIRNTGTSFNLAGLTGYYYNDTTTGFTFQLDAPSLGKQYCFGNRKARSGIITIQGLASVTIYYKGVAATTGATGSLTSSGAAGDFLCLVGTDATTYESTGSGFGTWTRH